MPMFLGVWAGISIPEHNVRVADLDPSQQCGSPCSSHQAQARSLTARLKLFLGTTTLQDKYPQSIQVAFASQILGAWETHPALLSYRSTEKLRQEGITIISSPSLVLAS